MSFLFNYDKYKKHNDDYDGYPDDDMDFEYSDEFIYEDEYGDAEQYYL